MRIQQWSNGSSSEKSELLSDQMIRLFTSVPMVQVECFFLLRNKQSLGFPVFMADLHNDSKSTDLPIANSCVDFTVEISSVSNHTHSNLVPGQGQNKLSDSGLKLLAMSLNRIFNRMRAFSFYIKWVSPSKTFTMR